MAKRFSVESCEGRLVPSCGGTKPPNRICEFFSNLTNEWLQPLHRPHVQLPAPLGGWTRYALTLTPDVVYARCQGFAGQVVEQIFHAPHAIPDDSMLLSSRVDHFFTQFNDVYRKGLERGYGWPQKHSYLPSYLPNEHGKTLMEAYYMRYSNLTLLLGPRHLLLSSWNPAPCSVRGYASQDTLPCTNYPFVLSHGYRWRGITDEYVETPSLIKQASTLLAAPWPLTGKESE